MALGAPALVYLHFKGVPFALAPQRMLGTIDESILLAVPMFLLAGRLMNHYGATEQTLSRLEKGEISAIKAIDELLAEELSLREGRRIGVALRMARLMPIKTLESFDFSFQPSLDRHRIMALAQLEFIRRAEVLHFLGPPGTGKSHLAAAIGVAAVKAGRSVYRCTLADMIEALTKAEREGRLAEKIRFYARAPCSSSTKSAICRSRLAGPTCSSSSSPPVTKKAQ